MNKKIAGVFQTEQDASQAIEDLKTRGYRTDDISVIAKNRKDMETISEETGTKAPEGVATGAATGGILGGVTGLLAGLGALAIPGVGPILAAGPIAATLTGAAVGAGAGGLVGGLIGFGIPEEEAKEYDTRVNEGKILVLVDADEERTSQVYDIFSVNNALNSQYYRDADTNTTAGASAADSDTLTGMDEKHKLRLREERLDVSKDSVRAGEVEVRKEVVEEQKTIDVPVSHEEVVIERRAVNDRETNEPIGRDETIRIPVSEERVDVHKHNVVTGKVDVHKRKFEETEKVQDTVKREEARINRIGDPAVKGDTVYDDANAGMGEDPALNQEPIYGERPDRSYNRC